MSKAKVNELISMTGTNLADWLDDVNVIEFRHILKIAMQEQDRDTRHACAEAITKLSAEEGA